MFSRHRGLDPPATQLVANVHLKGFFEKKPGKLGNRYLVGSSTCYCNAKSFRVVDV